jgi:hypothetical protein
MLDFLSVHLRYAVRLVIRYPLRTRPVAIWHLPYRIPSTQEPKGSGLGEPIGRKVLLPATPGDALGITYMATFGIDRT